MKALRDGLNPTPKASPWGLVDSCRELAPGVFQVSTPGHGGLMVFAEVELSERARTLNRYGGVFGGYYCYEEDCEWALPIFEHPEWDAVNWSWRHPDLTAEQAAECVKAEAEQTLRHWMREYFAGEEKS